MVIIILPVHLQDMAQLHGEILNRLSVVAMPEDQLIRDLKRSPADTAASVVQLELEGKVIRQPGGMIAKLCQLGLHWRGLIGVELPVFELFFTNCAVWLA